MYIKFNMVQWTLRGKYQKTIRTSLSYFSHASTNVINDKTKLYISLSPTSRSRVLRLNFKLQMTRYVKEPDVGSILYIKILGKSPSITTSFRCFLFTFNKISIQKDFVQTQQNWFYMNSNISFPQNNILLTTTQNSSQYFLYFPLPLWLVTCTATLPCSSPQIRFYHSYFSVTCFPSFG